MRRADPQELTPPGAEHSPVEQADDSERSEPHESPEQRSERQYQRNIERLNTVAQENLERSRLRLSLQKPQPLGAPPPLPQPQWKRPLPPPGIGGAVSGIGRSFRNAYFWMKGVLHPEQLSNLIAYLESTVVRNRYESATIKKEKYETFKARMESKGWSVSEGSEVWDDPSKVYVSFQRDDPYRFDRQDTKTLASLTGGPNDPIAVLEQLKRIGLTVTAHDLEYNLRDLQYFTSSTKGASMLVQMEKYGFSGRYLYFHHDDDPNRWDGGRPNITKEVAAIAEDPAVLSVYKDIVDGVLGPDLGHRYSYYPERTIRNARLLKESGDLDEILRWRQDLVGYQNFSVRELLEAEREEQAKEILRRISSQLHNPELLEWRSDVPFFEFCQKFSASTGVWLSLGQVEKYRALQAIPDALPIAVALSTIPLEHFDMSNLLNNEYTFNHFTALARNKTMARLIVQEDFRQMVRDFHEKVGYTISLSTLSGDYGSAQLVDFYQDVDFRKKFLSAQGIALARMFGARNLNIYDIKKYSTLMDAPAITETVEGLQRLGYQPKLDHVDSLVELANSPEFRQQLGQPSVKRLVWRLRREFQYEVTPWDLEDLVALANDEQSRQAVFSPAIKKFITQVRGVFQAKEVDMIIGLDPTFREQLMELSQTFGYRANVWNQHIEYETELQQLFADSEQHQRLFESDRRDMIARLVKNHRYHFSVIDVPQLLTLPLDFDVFLTEVQQGFEYESFSYSAEKFTKLLSLYAYRSSLPQWAHALRTLTRGYALGDDDILPFIQMMSGSTPPERIVRTANGFASAADGYAFRPSDAPALAWIADSGVTDSGLSELVALYRRFRPQGDPDVKTLSNCSILQSHEKEITETAAKLRELGCHLDPIANAPELLLASQHNIVEALAPLKPSDRQIVFQSIKDWMKVDPEKLPVYIAVLIRIAKNPSQEIQRLRPHLLSELLRTKDPEQSYSTIENIFIKNNLPTVGKIYKIFEILHPSADLKRTLEHNAYLSPMLRKAGPRRRYATIYADLLRVHLESGNRSLRDYLRILAEGESIVSEETVELMKPENAERLKHWLGKLETLYQNTVRGRIDAAAQPVNGPGIAEVLDRLKQSLEVREGQRITDRLAELFLKPAGIQSLEQALDQMRQAKKSAHQRGLDSAHGAMEGRLELVEGDLIKGVQEQYIRDILQNGSVAKEYLGAASDSDYTPLDTDVSRVTAEDAEGGYHSALSHSIPGGGGYGNLLFVIKNRGQYVMTTTEAPSTNNPRVLELFHSGSERHFGIRTGFATTQIDWMVATPVLMANERALQSLYYEIAKNGWYIPVTDTQGTIIFTPELYEQYRAPFKGIPYFEGDPLGYIPTAASDPHASQIQEIANRQSADRRRVDEVSKRIRSMLGEVFGKYGVTIKSRFDQGLLGAEFSDIGSTSRHTNTPGEIDFDFTIRIDSTDAEKVSGIIEGIAAGLKPGRMDNFVKLEEGRSQFRGFGCTGVTGEPIDIDVGFIVKSQVIEFGSHEAIEQKLEGIRSQYGQAAQDDVIANIVLAKEVLKEGKAYKKLEHGGMGGIGVENWILANSGNIRRAFETFWEASHSGEAVVPLEQFKGKYRVMDAGINLAKGFHDDFVYLLKEEGYRNMLSVIGKYRSKNVPAETPATN